MSSIVTQKRTSGFRWSDCGLLFLLIILATGSTALSQSSAYVQPALLEADEGHVSVIVSAGDSQAAARAVEAVGGQITSDLWLIGAVGALVSQDALAQLATAPEVKAITANQRTQTADSRNNGSSPRGQLATGKRDGGNQNSGPAISQSSNDAPSSRTRTSQSGILATANSARVYDFRNPVTIDVGADQLHNGLADSRPITGRGVTVAVVDSGVYFDPLVRQTIGAELQRLFVGQADFAGDGQCAGSGSDFRQYEDYCWTNERTSVDRYGHGSHVAGTIWNNFRDLETGVTAGVAPQANILSVRVLGDDGIGTYEDVIEGIQFVVANKDTYRIRVLNLSLSAYANTPYFVDPLNRAAEAAWAHGIVVVAAAGNIGPGTETITVPGNDPYVITVGAVDGSGTAGAWDDDVVPSWSSYGPTQDGFVKPDVLAPGTDVVSFMYNDPLNSENSAYLVQIHPDYSESASFFRMNGTSMATAVASGVVALMLDAQPELTPEQVKYRLMASANSAITTTGEQLFSPLQQGAGRIWAPDAVLGDIPLRDANEGMDVHADLDHPWHDGDSLDPEQNPDLAYHYLGPVQRLISDDGQYYLYFVVEQDSGAVDLLGVAQIEDGSLLERAELDALDPSFNDGQWTWSESHLWSAARYSWGGARYSWGGARYSWGGARYSWGGARYSWGGARYSWGGARYSWGGARYSWGGSNPTGAQSQAGATTWVDN